CTAVKNNLRTVSLTRTARVCYHLNEEKSSSPICHDGLSQLHFKTHVHTKRPEGKKLKLLPVSDVGHNFFFLFKIISVFRYIHRVHIPLTVKTFNPKVTLVTGIPIRTTLDNSTTVQYAGLLHQLTMKAKSTVRDIDPQNDLTFLRIRSKKHEIMVAPDKEYLLIVIQNPCE
uniref:Dynein light chain roadblock-type 2 n=1 Tax=Lynx canadensis TaxID=61383 RepID=A0A667HWL5_LYNCA